MSSDSGEMLARKKKPCELGKRKLLVECTVRTKEHNNNRKSQVKRLEFIKGRELTVKTMKLVTELAPNFPCS